MSRLRSLRGRDFFALKPGTDNVHTFKHVTVMEVAYGRMLYSYRKKLHQSVGEWYETIVPKTRNPQLYSLLAYHWSKVCEGPAPESTSSTSSGSNSSPGEEWRLSSEIFVKAVRYMRQASELASRQFASHEANGWLRKSMKIVSDTLPAHRDDPDLFASTLTNFLNKHFSHPELLREISRLDQNAGYNPLVEMSLKARAKVAVKALSATRPLEAFNLLSDTGKKPFGNQTIYHGSSSNYLKVILRLINFS